MDLPEDWDAGWVRAGKGSGGPLTGPEGMGSQGKTEAWWGSMCVLSGVEG